MTRADPRKDGERPDRPEPCGERLDRFMARANAAYYGARDPFSDFTTAPEISQVFGEILGAWATVVWQQMGRPDPVILAEAGPGRGTLMADAWRLITRVAPDFGAAARLHLIETSPRLRQAQRAALPDAAPCWHDSAFCLPEGPMILLANEFLDALPIRQFRREAAGWSERYVLEGEAHWRASAPPPARAGAPAAAPGDVVECCAPALELVRWLAVRLSRPAAGAALLLDYGPGEPGFGDTLQALRAGGFADPFGPAGLADLTAHVDFPTLGEAAHAAASVVRVHGPEPQGRFLAALGLFARIERLARSQPTGAGGALVEAAHRLADPARMGSLFKAMVLCDPSLPVPPGFAAPPPTEDFT